VPSLVVVVPGSIDTLTGGYIYDRRMVAGLRQRGWQVSVRELDSSFPYPTASARDQAAVVLAAIPSGSLVVIDGLALGPLAPELTQEAGRLRLVALVHHPLAAETGVEPHVAARLAAEERQALAAVRLVVVTSQATADSLAGYDVEPNRIAVAVPGTDPAPLARGSRPGPCQLLNVSTLTPRKGHEVLFGALASVADRRWRLACVGSLDRDPQTVERLRAQLRRFDLEGRVSLIGEVAAAGLADYYDAADVFVLPTLYEGYGMAVAEALARGLPVVSTPTGAIPELVGGVAGLLVPPGDERALSAALAEVLDGEQVRARLAEGARRVRDRLPTWDEASATFADALERSAHDS
jgi:glycosyltransferase involved in cell wall biosynthesis